MEKKRRSEFLSKKSPSKKQTATDAHYSWFCPVRNARATVLPGLQQRQAVGSQRGHVEVFRFGDRGRHWFERGHDGAGVLHDAKSEFSGYWSLGRQFSLSDFPGVACIILFYMDVRTQH